MHCASFQWNLHLELKHFQNNSQKDHDIKISSSSEFRQFLWLNCGFSYSKIINCSAKAEQNLPICWENKCVFTRAFGQIHLMSKLDFLLYEFFFIDGYIIDSNEIKVNARISRIYFVRRKSKNWIPPKYLRRFGKNKSFWINKCKSVFTMNA